MPRRVDDDDNFSTMTLPCTRCREPPPSTPAEANDASESSVVFITSNTRTPPRAYNYDFSNEVDALDFKKGVSFAMEFTLQTAVRNLGEEYFDE